MFGFLKDKLKSALSIFSKKVDKEAEDVEEKPKKEEKKSEKPIQKEKPSSKVPEKKDEKKPESKKSGKVEQKKPDSKKPAEVQKEEPKKHEEKRPEAKKTEPVKPIHTPKKEEKIVEKQKHVETVSEKKVEEKKPAPEKVDEPKKQGFFGKLFGKKEEPVEVAKPIVEAEVVEEQEESIVEEEPEETKPKHKEHVEEEPEKRGFFQTVSDAFTKKKISEDKFNELFEDIEITLLENNVSFEVVEKIKTDLSKEIVEKPLPRGEISNIILARLKKSIEELFDVPGIDVMKEISHKKPYIISFIGVNGSGKTTQLAKLAHLLQKKGKTCVIAACDTFRAAAIQQLEEHAHNLNIKIIKHNYGADPAAVAFDAIEHAKAQKIDVVLIDTAGRLHSNSNLMAELHKLVRVAKPDLNIFVGESITGNDCIEQAQQFGEAVPIHGIILTKADVDEKGGAAISISYVTGKPILYLGNGQGYDDLQPFDSNIVVESLGL